MQLEVLQTKTERVVEVRNSWTMFITTFLLGGCLSAEQPVSSGAAETANLLDVNGSPTITGNPPAAVLFGKMYDFEPDANDPDGDSLSFHISNKPHWADFDESTGRLFGQPTLASVGTYDNVVISVTDSKTTVSLRTFSITVSQNALGTVTLNWLPPTQNTDGSPLLDLAGYKIYYGLDSRAYDHEIHVYNPGITQYVVENLVSGTYFFSATSINESGKESTFSTEAIRTVDF